MSDEIDRIIASCPALRSVCSDGGSDERAVSKQIRLTLEAAGYVIAPPPTVKGQ